MSIIGNPIVTTNYISDSFSGDSSTVAFTLSQAPASAASIAVYISGLYQIPTSAYTISGTTLTFTGAPPTGTNNITVLHLGVKSATLVPVDASVTPAMLNNANVIYWSTSNNNVGIGNTTPTSQLTVTGTAALGNTTFAGTISANGGVGTAGQVLTSGATGNAYWSTLSTTLDSVLGSGNTTTKSLTTGPLTVNGALTATSASLNGITLSDYTLYQGLVARVDNGYGIGINSANSAHNAYLYFGYGTTSGAMQGAAIGRIGGDVLSMFTGGTQRMSVMSSGLVGIANTNPNYTLHVTRVAGDTDVAMFKGNAANALIRFQDTGSADFSIGSDGGSPSGNSFIIYDRTNSQYRFMIDRNGVAYFNSGYGSAGKAYGCRAWVHFNGNNGSINGSGNIAYVTRNGTGDYTVGFATGMPDTVYTITGGLKPPSAYSGNNARDVHVRYDTYPTTSSFRIVTATAGAGYEDFEYVYVTVHR